MQFLEYAYQNNGSHIGAFNVPLRAIFGLSRFELEFMWLQQYQ